MKVYADYEYYANTYKGKADQATFESNIVEASQYIRYVTMKKSDSYEGDEVKGAACSVVDAYVSCSGDKARVTSETTDGYSVSYSSQGEAGETTEQLRNRKAYASARMWLAGTGLLCQKVVHCR